MNYWYEAAKVSVVILVAQPKARLASGPLTPWRRAAGPAACRPIVGQVGGAPNFKAWQARGLRHYKEKFCLRLTLAGRVGTWPFG